MCGDAFRKYFALVVESVPCTIPGKQTYHLAYHRTRYSRRYLEYPKMKSISKLLISYIAACLLQLQAVASILTTTTTAAPTNTAAATPLLADFGEYMQMIALYRFNLKPKSFHQHEYVGDNALRTIKIRPC